MTDPELHGHLVGQQGSRKDLNTPVLIVDLDALGRNIEAMAAFARGESVKLRPHAKTHKSVEIAKLQIAAGAVGICCAKLGEAEALADGGVTHGLHITSPVVSTPAIARLVALNAWTENLMCAVDAARNVEALAAAADASRPLAVIIDLDPGLRRTGVASADAALKLLSAIKAQPTLKYAGVQCYCGAEQHVEDFNARQRSMQDKAAFLRTILEALSAAGGAPEIVTGGGTGTHRIDVSLGLFTELQVGSYVFMDSQYLACDLTGDNASSPFETALMIDARVISANTPGLVTLDAGFKAMATDAGGPTIVAGAPEGSTYHFMGDEHGLVRLPKRGTLPLAERVTLAAPHCDPTVNLYDFYHVVRGDTLCALWPVSARGRSR